MEDGTQSQACKRRRECVVIFKSIIVIYALIFYLLMKQLTKYGQFYCKTELGFPVRKCIVVSSERQIDKYAHKCLYAPICTHVHVFGTQLWKLENVIICHLEGPDQGYPEVFFKNWNSREVKVKNDSIPKPKSGEPGGKHMAVVPGNRLHLHETLVHSGGRWFLPHTALLSPPT